MRVLLLRATGRQQFQLDGPNMTVANPALNFPGAIDKLETPEDGFPAIIRDSARLTALTRLALLDTPAEQAFDRLTRLATKILRAPVAILSLVDGDRSFFKSSVGLPDVWESRREMPLSYSVCQHVVAVNKPLIINDARAHPLVSANEAVAELRIVAYMGIPLVTADGHALGTFAVIDTVPRQWDPDDVATLSDLATSAMTEIELRAETNQRLRSEQRLNLLEAVVGNASVAVAIVEAGPALLSDPSIVFVNDAYSRLTGFSAADIVGNVDSFLGGAAADRTQIETVRTTLASGKSARLEALTQRKDGTVFWAESNIVPIADKTGRYSHWVIVQRDVSVQKATEMAARQSEARRLVILESSPDCIITLDDQERVTEFNPAAEKAFIISRKDAVGKPLSELIVAPLPSEVPPREIARYMTSEASRLPDNRLEVLAVRADGTKFAAELALTAVPLDLPMFTAVLRDISERKRAERRLAAQYDCTRIIAESTVLDNTVPQILRAICENIDWRLGQLWQPDTKADVLRCVAVWHNPASELAKFASISPAIPLDRGVGLPGRVWATRKATWANDVSDALRFPRAEAAARCGLHGAFAFPIVHAGEFFGVMEFFHEDKLEADEPLLDLATAIGRQVGQFIGRMRTEAMLRQSEERYRSLVLASSQIVWITDADGQLLLGDFSMSTWLDFTGQTADQARGAGWLEAVHPDDRARTSDAWAKAVGTTTAYHVEYRLRSSAGEYRHTASRGVPVTNGQVCEWVGMTSDITEQKNAVELLGQAKETAEAANRAKSEFFSRMSHELRTPLNVILGFGQLLELDALSDSQRESVEQIINGGQHLLALINEVLDIARIEAGGGGAISLEEVGVRAVVDEVCAMVQPLASKAGLRLLPEQQDTRDRIVRADLQRLKQVLLNLLSNAIKYNRPGGTVAVSWTVVDNKVRISVADTGPGIAPEKMHRLFAPFDRLGAEHNGTQGTGLGLTLSKGLVEAMNGKMGVESALGQGSTFWIELDRLDGTVTAEAAPAIIALAELNAHRTGTVLCIEDNPANIRLLEHIMQLRPAVRLLTAVQGRIGLDLACEHRPDVIFTDLQLPDISGEIVLRRLRAGAETREIPVIVLSADASPHLVDRLLAEGANRFLTKPFPVREFLQIVDDALQLKEPEHA